MQHFDTKTTYEQQTALLYQIWCRNYNFINISVQEAQLGLGQKFWCSDSYIITKILVQELQLYQKVLCRKHSWAHYFGAATHNIILDMTAKT